MDQLSSIASRLGWYTLTLSVGSLVVATLWTVSVIFYNVFLHPLRKYPGPRSWAATRLPWCYWQYYGVLLRRLLELHKQYGHTVRIAPNELSYTSDTAWKSIYGHRSAEMGKDPIFLLHTPTGVQNILTADRATHTRQRRLLSHAFSEKALREQEDILQHYITKLLEQFSARWQSGPLDLAAWFHYLTFDLIASMSFGTQMHCLDTGAPDPYIAVISQVSKEITFTQMLKFYNLDRIRAYFMPKGVAGQRAANMKRARDMVESRIERDGTNDRKDFLHYVLAANETEKGMTRPEIHVNAFSLPIAGSESTASALAGAVFYILCNTHVYEKLVEEIRGGFAEEKDITIASVTNLPYMEAVLTETLRLYPPVAITNPRVVPGPHGENIDGAHVPAGTSVGVNHSACYRDPANFREPDAFHPERWLDVGKYPEAKAFEDDIKNAMQPFSFGPRNCIGKNLAKAEMRVALGRLLWGFDLEPEGSEEGADGWHEGSNGGADSGHDGSNGAGTGDETEEKKGLDGAPTEKTQRFENWRDQQKLFGFWEKSPLMCNLTPVVRDENKKA
ncbi:MAG: hypothetical protein M1831_006856 [Alyxoria varia]|nr:MAG: hypothetical protein M1831_006856 [Alyxoria varia]